MVVTSTHNLKTEVGSMLHSVLQVCSMGFIGVNFDISPARENFFLLPSSEFFVLMVLPPYCDFPW